MVNTKRIFRYSARLCIRGGRVKGRLTVSKDMVLFDPSLSDRHVRTKGVLPFQLYVEMQDIINIGAVRPFSPQADKNNLPTVVQLQLMDRALFFHVKMPNDELLDFIFCVNDWASKTPEEIARCRPFTAPITEYAAGTMEMQAHMNSCPCGALY